MRPRSLQHTHTHTHEQSGPPNGAPRLASPGPCISATCATRHRNPQRCDDSHPKGSSKTCHTRGQYFGLPRAARQRSGAARAVLRSSFGGDGANSTERSEHLDGGEPSLGDPLRHRSPRPKARIRGKFGAMGRHVREEGDIGHPGAPELGLLKHASGTEMQIFEPWASRFRRERERPLPTDPPSGLRTLPNGPAKRKNEADLPRVPKGLVPTSTKAPGEAARRAPSSACEARCDEFLCPLRDPRLWACAGVCCRRRPFAFRWCAANAGINSEGARKRRPFGQTTPPSPAPDLGWQRPQCAVPVNTRLGIPMSSRNARRVWAESGQLSNVVGFMPNLTRLGTSRIELGPWPGVGPTLGRVQAELGEFRPKLDGVQPMPAKLPSSTEFRTSSTWGKLGRNRPTLSQFRQKLGLAQTISPEFGRMWSTLDRGKDYAGIHSIMCWPHPA